MFIFTLGDIFDVIILVILVVVAIIILVGSIAHNAANSFKESYNNARKEEEERKKAQQEAMDKYRKAKSEARSKRFAERRKAHPVRAKIFDFVTNRPIIFSFVITFLFIAALSLYFILTSK